ILSQRLVPAKNGQRVAASEVMMNTPYISELIKKGDVIAVKEAIRTGTERGMLSFDSSLYNLVREGRIELEEALSSADSRTNLEAKINFGRGSGAASAARSRHGAKLLSNCRVEIS